MKNVLDTIESRSSTRGYTSQKLTDAELQTLLKAGLQAPTAVNRQEIHISVVNGDHPILAEIDEEKNTLMNNSAPTANFYYSAPLVLILSGDKTFSWSTLDAGIAVENIALAAEGLGLGSVIIGVIKGAMRGEKQAYFAKALKFPENHEFEIAIAIGHKATAKAPHEIDPEKNVSYVDN